MEQSSKLAMARQHRKNQFWNYPAQVKRYCLT